MESGKAVKQHENIILKKSFALAVETVRIYRALVSQHEYILSRQLLKSATSPGAMFREAQSAQSRKDFISKCEIALKELRETEYWIDLLEEMQYLAPDALNTLRQLNLECLRMSVSIVKSTKKGKQF